MGVVIHHLDMFQTLVYLSGAAVCWGLWQAWHHPEGVYGDILRWLLADLRTEPPAVTVAALPAAPAAPKPRARRARAKVAA